MSIRDVLSNVALFALHAPSHASTVARKSNHVSCQNCVKYSLKPCCECAFRDPV
jgi:hypothetical protein